MSKRRPGSKHYASLNQRRWQAVRLKVLRRDNWRCTECGNPGKLEVHHVNPLEHGGAKYDPDNLTTICRSCHIDLHRQENMTPGRQAWIDFVQELL